MGDRGNIRFHFENNQDIYFYMHWGGSDLIDTLQQALEHARPRWQDESYCTRMIIGYIMHANATCMDECGIGISTYMPDNEHDILEVDYKKQRINLYKYEWDCDQGNQVGELIGSKAFQEFIDEGFAEFQ